MAKNKICIYCGANLDFGEKCTCGESTNIHQENESGKYYRQIPEYTLEQQLEALSVIKAMLY